jgi:uncharacterized phage infection (PIP) family protein YhgE
MAFAVGGAVLATAAINAYSANKTAGAQKDAANKADATSNRQYDQTRADNMPALTSRNAALAELSRLLRVGGDPSSVGYGSLAGPVNAGDVQNEAGYQFGLNQGIGQLNNQLAARGMRNSGAALKAGNRYAQDYAGTKYDAAFNRAQTNRSAQLNPLQSLAGLGQSGASTIAQAGQNNANNVSQTQASLGNALGANYLAQGNALTSGINQAAGWYANQNRVTPTASSSIGAPAVDEWWM